MNIELAVSIGVTLKVAYILSLYLALLGLSYIVCKDYVEILYLKTLIPEYISLS